jgi:hypothetical protein
MPYEDAIPIRIRNNLQVYLANIPHDLTPQEAKKICNVVTAMATEAKETGGSHE